MLRHALLTTAQRSTALYNPALSRTLNTLAIRSRKELLISSGYNNRISVPVRQFSDKQSKPNQDPNADGSDRTDIVLTPGQKVAAGSRLFMFGGLFLFAGTCAYFIMKELIPTKMAPNSVFSRASSLVLKSSQIQDRFGEPLKVYGRDHGGHREGRRNFIEHTDYTDPEDGSKRCRVRFNLEGKFGNAFVFCEVSDNLPRGEDFVYLMVQDKRNGHVITLVDNRSKIATQRMAGGSAEGREVFANLLGGGKK